MKNFYKNDISTIQSIILLVISYAWITYFLTLLGAFYTSLVWGIMFILTIILVYKKILVFKKISKTLLYILIISTILGGFIISNSNPTIFTGRDQGSISQAAINLAKYHTSHFHTLESDIFFKHYGAGKALNFPGFYYTATGALTTQFPLPYITFLAGFIGAFGLNGIAIANAILFIVFILTISSIARFILPTKFLWWFLLLLLTSAPILYFTSFSLSENLASALIFSLITLFLFYYYKKNNLTLSLIFITVGILTFTRIEGFWFLFITLYLFFRNREIIKKIIIEHTFAIALFTSSFFCVFLASIITNFSFYKTLLGVFISKLPVSHSMPNQDKFAFLLNIFITFNLLIPLIFCAIYVLYISIKKRRKRFILLPLFLVVPLFVYYINPNISQDAPWMLRRYVFAILPITILYTTSFLSLFSSTKYKYLASVLYVFLIFFNLSTTIPLLTNKNHVNLNHSTQILAKKFSSSDDLLLVSPNVSGDRFSMLTGPLRTSYDLHAVYFFNQNDYNNIQKDKFKDIFLISSEKDLNLYQSLIKDLKPYDIFTIKTSFLPPQKSYPLSLSPQEVTIKNYIFKLK